MTALAQTNMKDLPQHEAATAHPLVSVGILAYNHAEFIVECLESFRKQNYPNLHIYISDDFSKDNTRAIIRDYMKAHPGFIREYYERPANIGIAKSCNFLIEEMKGDYIQIFSGDDIALPNKISAQVAALEKEPDASFAFSNMEWFWSNNGKKICNHFGWLQKPAGKLADMIEDSSIPSPTLLLRSSKIKDIRYREDLPCINDFYFIVELMQQGPALYIPHVLVRYRKHNKSLTLNQYFPEERTRILHLLEQNVPRTQENLDALQKYQALIHYADIMNSIGQGEKLAALKKLTLIFPTALTSPKWIVRLCAIFVNLLKPGKR